MAFKVPYILATVDIAVSSLKTYLTYRGVFTATGQRNYSVPLPSIDPQEMLHLIQKADRPAGDGGEREQWFSPSGDPQYGRFKIYNVYNVSEKSVNNRSQINTQSRIIGQWSNKEGDLELEWARPLGDIVWPDGVRGEGSGEGDGEGEVPTSRCSEDCRPGTRVIYGYRRCCWTCVNCTEGHFTARSQSERCERCPPRQTSSPDRTRCDDLPEVYLRFTDWVSVINMVLASLGLLATAAITAVLLRHRTTPVVRSTRSNYVLNFLLLGSLVLAFLTPALYVLPPGPASCVVQPVHFGLTFVLCTAVLLAKTDHILTVFYSPLQASLAALRAKRRLVDRRQLLIVSGLTSGEVVLLGVNFYLDPPRVTREVEPMRSVQVDCGVGWGKLQLASMVYIALLSALCLLMAFRARKLPTFYNEARHIAFTVLALALVWITSFAAYYQQSRLNRMSILCFCVNAASGATLWSMFVPKVYIILWSPEENDWTVLHRNRARWLFREGLVRRTSRNTSSESDSSRSSGRSHSSQNTSQNTSHLTIKGRLLAALRTRASSTASTTSVF